MRLEEIPEIIKRSKLPPEEKERLLKLFEEKNYYALGIAAYKKGLDRVVRILKEAGYITTADLRRYSALIGRAGRRRYFTSLQEYYAFWQREIRKVMRSRKWMA